MGYPRDEDGYILDTDASNVGIGAVLTQIQDGRERVIAYGSKTLNKSERNYCITDKELLAVKYFVEYYRQYLLGRKFLIRTDHQALIWQCSLKEPKGRIARWMEILSAFDFKIQHRPGNKHNNADTMSRHMDLTNSEGTEHAGLRCGPCTKCQRRTHEMQGSLGQAEIGNTSQGGKTQVVRTRTQSAEDTRTPWTGGYSNEQLKELQENDEHIGPILKFKRDNHRPEGKEMEKYSPATRHYWQVWSSLEEREGLLFKTFVSRDGTGPHSQFLVPENLKSEVLYQMHNSVLSGHLGKKKTHQKIKQRFYWYEMKEDIQIWIAKCDICSANKPLTKTQRAPLGQMQVGAPMDRVATNLLGPLPVTPRGNRYILTMTDYFTKWVEVIPVPDQTAVTCANVMLNEFICRYGCPLAIHSDQGRCYESEIFQQLCELFEVRKTRTSPRNPKCNGQVERFNRTLLGMIKSYIRGEQRDWDLYLGCLSGAYHATQHESTGLTPNLLMLGREVRLPSDVTQGGLPLEMVKSSSSPADYILHVQKKM